MGHAQKTKASRNANTYIITRPSQTYTTAIATYNVFAIRGGPIVITLLGGVELAVNGAEDLDVTVNGIATDAAGVVAINGGVGWPWVTSLNILGTLINGAQAVPLTPALLHPKGFICGLTTTYWTAGLPAYVTLTFGTGVSWTGEIFMKYRKLSPYSYVALV
jgi:hypothetical protein